MKVIFGKNRTPSASVSVRFRFSISSTVGQSNAEQLRYFSYKPSLVRLGRSRVHGVGLFARFDIPQGELLLEYVGEIIRLSLADDREKKYQRMVGFF